MNYQFDFRNPSITFVDQVKAWEERRKRIQVLQRAEKTGDERAREMARKWLVEDSRRVRQ